jgi:hypothetical protein
MLTLALALLLLAVTNTESKCYCEVSEKALVVSKSALSVVWHAQMSCSVTNAVAEFHMLRVCAYSSLR